MTLLPYRVDTALRLLAQGRLSEFAERLGARLSTKLHERSVAYCLRRDLDLPFPAPDAKIPIHVREAVDADAEHLFADDQPGLDQEERRELAWRRAHFAKRIPTCFVAIDERSGKPCYVQWLMSSRNNAEIRALGAFPALKPDEALLENAYTPSAYRGLGIMAAAMARIAEQGSGIGARYVMTFVGEDNLPSLKGCERAGFARHSRRIVTTRLFNLSKSVAFVPLAGGDDARGRA